ncbi:hypothetical protein KS872_004667 [Vibrio parahaemolyticus]|uniref:hypothetical protein n=1 Tax=Vibrio parahaemolyticus TaxID=670 RepID=UPI001485A2EF|nr:hypothetical protein [Vibrio parahaemolyticus]EHR0574862.1 hypothetical protein [Vibrio parahaemolyticus]EME0114606.1 hypothetical protein [Vibrio parahaemolyticus]NNU14070.1 hypothetical protein [Vibrio parahaemolyticus]
MVEQPTEVFWTALEIVNLIGVIAWPVASVTIALLLRGRISETIQNLFSNTSVMEVSAAGFSAKFSESKQASNTPEDSKESAVIAAVVGNDASDVFQRQKQNETKLSHKLLNNLKAHRESLKLSPEQEIELIETELSLAQARLYFMDLNRVLFRSQLSLFNLLKSNHGKMTISEVIAYFESVKGTHPNVYESTELHSYLAYPMRVGLIEKNHDNYLLTEYGESYVDFMDKNTHLIGELAQN